MYFTETTEMCDPIDMVETIAAAKDWAYTRDLINRAIIVHEGVWAQFGTVVEDVETGISFRCFYEFHFPGFTELEVLRLINQLNNRLRSGKFSGLLYYDADSKQLSYSTNIDFSDERPVSADDIAVRIETMVTIVDRFYPAFQAVAGSSVTTSERNDGLTCWSPGMPATEAIELVLGGSLGTA